ncbi:MAG: NfeD family protein [Proteobacteria bacterium]|nr:NfeD family protein [Pseudomonadota bacterium]
MSFTIVFWYWWALAGVLLVCEMMLPGVVFLFLAVGAAVAGLFLLVVSDLSLEMQLAVFAVFSVAAAVGLRPILRKLQHRSDDPNLNERGNALIGKVLVLDQPILRGRGRVTMGDGSWTVTGPDMVAGAKVRVAAVDGTELRVEPAP